MISPVSRYAFSGLLAVTLLLTGCAGTHLYREYDDKLAQQAVAQYQSVDLLAIIDAERANLDATLQYELTVVDRLVDIVLQREWYQLVTSSRPLSTSFLDDLIGRRKAELGVDQFTDEEVTNLIRLEAEIRDLDRQINDASSAARSLFGVHFPLCGKDPLPAELPTNIVSRAQAYSENRPGGGGTITLTQVLYPEYQQKCQDRNAQLDSTLRPFRDGRTGLLSQAIDEWQRAKQALNDEKNAALAAKADYDAAVEEMVLALESRDRDERLVPESLTERAEQIGRMLDEMAANAGSVGLSNATAERIRHIDVLLGAIVKAEVDAAALADPSVARSAAIAASLSTLGDEIKTLYTKRSLDPVSPLIIEKNRQQVLLEMAKSRVARQERRIELLRQRYIAVTDQLELIRTIDNAAQREGVAEVLQGTADDALSRRCRTQACAEVYRMFLKYVGITDSVRRRLEKIDYQLIDLEHRIALDESEHAIGLWHAMIATPLQQLAAYHGSGFRPEALADMFIKFSTLGGIAYGVNR